VLKLIAAAAAVAYRDDLAANAVAWYQTFSTLAQVAFLVWYSSLTYS
jgi:hypothetical protein